MKNLVLLGLTALVLFSVSAGLSVFLQQLGNKSTTDATAEAKKDADTAKKPDPAQDEKKPAALKPDKPAADPVSASAAVREQADAVKDREARLEKRETRLEVVMADMRAEAAALENLTKQVIAEAKAVAVRQAETDARLTQLEQERTAVKTAADTAAKKDRAEADAAEGKNLNRIGLLTENMPADTAAKVIQQMADGGKLDTAVKVLAQMKERQAARVLAEIPDAALAAQLLDKMRTLKRPAPATGPTPAGS